MARAHEELCCELRRHVRNMEEAMACCDRMMAADPPPFRFRRRFFFARRSLGVARLAFLSILGLLGLAAVR